MEILNVISHYLRFLKLFWLSLPEEARLACTMGVVFLLVMSYFVSKASGSQRVS